nr:hypothetical protein [Tanacetum cinerariifolium]
MFQSWRALTLIINLCLTRKTSGFERPKAPRKHKFHPKPDSSLHLPNEEPVLGYLKFSAKGTKREVFGMPIPGSDPDSPAPKPTKNARKPKPTAPKAHPRPSVSKLVHGFVSKKRTPISTLKSVDESVAEDVPAKEPHVDAEEADMQRALEESLKSMHDVPRGPLPPVVIRKPELEKYQPLPKPKKKSHADQYIFQRYTSTPIGSSGHDESSSLYVELGLSDREEESQEVVPGAGAGGQGEGQAGPDPGAQAEGQAGPDPSAQDEGQAGSNPDEQSEGQAGPDPGNARADEQPMPSPVVHAGSDHEHMDLDVADVSPQPSTEQMDEGFSATAYPKVQKNLKLTVEEHVLLEEPASSSGTLSSLQHLSKDLSFGDLFFSDKPSKADNDKATAETKVEAMVSVTIQQDMSSIPPMTSPIIDLTSILESPKRIGKLEHIMANLIQENKKLEQRLDSHGARLYILEQLDIPHQLYEALEKSMSRDHSEELANDLAEAHKKKKKSRESSKTPPGSPPHEPPPPPSPAGPSGASGSSQVLPYHLHLHPPIKKDMALDEQAQSSDDEDIVSAHIPKTGDIAMFIDWFCKRQGITELKPQDLEGPAFQIVKVFHPDVIHLQYQMEECHKLLTDSMDDSILRHNVGKPLPLGGPPGQVTIQSDFFFNKDLEYLRYGSKGSRPALHTSEGDRSAVRTHMRIISVVRIEVFSMYGYDYMKKIVLRRIDLNEHVIAKQDFKYLYPKDFQLGIESYQTQLNLTKPRWDATGFEYKHDYTVIDSLRDVTFRDRYGVQMMMRFNEIHKFSDGTLQQIEETLDYRVKEFKINRMNPGLNTRFWTRKDVDRSKAFMFAIQKRLKTKRIFCNRESFVGGHVRDGDYRLLKCTE